MIVNCSNCNKDINKKPCHVKMYKDLFCDRVCSSEFKAKDSVIKPCAYCSKEVKRSKTEAAKSKNGNLFCNRSCATSFNNTAYKSRENNPNWVDGAGSYRSMALKTNEHACAKCGYDECPEILEVHHINEDRSNNTLDNLLVVCPNCHTKIHKSITC